MEDDFRNVLQKASIWILSASVTILGFIVWGNHLTVGEHEGKLRSLWTDAFYERIADDLRYPVVHETYRELYTAQNELFHEQVRQFMAAGGRFSKSDGDILEGRIRELEKEIAILRAKPSHIGGRHYYNEDAELDKK